ncbi:hypothetical protein HIM_07502 [Hirsutella minnesotensis 3608]|uniref:Calcineurin-like phosphoesterase domain-containing protein n=1 Tax=Hirsutella minnesotensis 3608 TaxID=1043627 RepID=A0A0F7ZTH4_9HYPO|nr:hypothetical protein HIM_07502 [Hirsutella minnesotensis 3608]
MRAVSKAITTRLFSSNRPKLQILSDLHLEVGQQYATFAFPATAPFLVLAGDVGRLVDYDSYLAFLAGVVARYQKVFMVLGNHEFYGLDYESGLAQAQRLAKVNVDERQLVVVTHHAPSLEGTSHPQHAQNPWTSAFETELMTGNDWHGVKAWIFGHTHFSTDVKLSNGIRLVANQRGYVLLGNATPRQEAPNSKKSAGARAFDAAKAITLGH